METETPEEHPQKLVLDLDQLQKEAEIVSIKDDSLGISIDLKSTKQGIVELANMALNSFNWVLETRKTVKTKPATGT